MLSSVRQTLYGPALQWRPVRPLRISGRLAEKLLKETTQLERWTLLAIGHQRHCEKVLVVESPTDDHRAEIQGTLSLRYSFHPLRVRDITTSI
jgi:hypothetical protein